MIAEKKTICVDLDGVLAQYDGWKGVDHIGDPLPGAVEFVKRLSEHAEVVIHTTRCNAQVNQPDGGYWSAEAWALKLGEKVQTWLLAHGFGFLEVYGGQGKPMASAYVDDRAVVCRAQNDPDEPGYAYDQAFIQALALVKGN